jgi:hypothetical protein
VNEAARDAALVRLDAALVRLERLEPTILAALDKVAHAMDSRLEANRQHISQFWHSLQLREMRQELREIRKELAA